MMLRRAALLVVGSFALCARAEAAVWYVDDSAPAGGAGTSWAVPFNTLQAALNNAALANGDEVRVGQGVYKPASPAGPRSFTFNINKNIALRGGYFGFGSGTPDARTVDPNATVLSGDLNGDDGANFVNTADNSIRVVTISGTPTITIERFSIRGGNANVTNVTGGGLYVPAGSLVTVRECDFRGNQASQWGGAIDHNGLGASVFSKCTFWANRALNYGGAVSISNGSGARLVNCYFAGNNLTGATSGSGGGAMYLSGTTSAVNCVFSGNGAIGGGTAGGGGVASNGAATITNCTFANNTSNTGGGGYLCIGGTATITNSILAFNSAPSGTQYASIPGSTVTLSYSDVQGGAPGTGNINTDPLFNDADGFDNIPGTLDDDLTLKRGYPGSGCIDSGNAAALPADFADLDGDSNTTKVIPFDAIGNPRQSDDPITPNGAAAGTPAVDMGAYEVQGSAGAVGPVIYVDDDAAGSSQFRAGDSWNNALTSLQDALNLARAYPAIVTEIRLAAGTYKPTTTGDRNVYFLVDRPIAVRGGYAGNFSYFGAPGFTADSRDITGFRTVLSGDLAGNDVGTSNNSENSFNVLILFDCAAVLDGVTVLGGNGTFGSGVRAYYASTIQNCDLRYNSASDYGAALYFSGGACAVTVKNCLFFQNITGGFGGAVYLGLGIDSNSPERWIVNCRFAGNNAFYGGAIFGPGGFLTNRKIVNCTFSGNGANTGGAVVLTGSVNATSDVIDNCTFSGNSSLYAGALKISATCSTVSNCIFWGDHAANSDNEIQLTGIAPSPLKNCVVQGGYTGVNISSNDPRFIDQLGPDGTVGTLDDDLRLSIGSSAIDLGDPALLPADYADINGNANTAEPLPLDLAGNSRSIDGDTNTIGLPDAGAYEFPSSVANLTSGVLYNTLSPAITAASAGDKLLAPASTFGAEPAIDFLGKAIGLCSTGAIVQPSGGAWTLANSGYLQTPQGFGLTIAGTLTVPTNAYAAANSDSFTAGAGTRVTVSSGATLGLNVDAASLSGTTRLMAGSSLNVAGPLSLGGTANLTGAAVNAGAMTLSATTTWTSSTISAPSLAISAAGRFTGSGEVDGAVTNSGRVYTVGNTLFVGNLTNNAGGVITVQIGTATLIGTLVNNGTINGLLSNPPMPPPGSDEGTVAFYRGYSDAERTSLGDGMFIRGDYIAGAASNLSLPDAVWKLSVAGSYDVAINSNANYDMRLAELNLAKPDNGPSTIEAMSLDRGAVLAGLDRTLPGSYPIGTLRIGAGANVSTADNRDNANDGQGNCEAVYCENLIVESGASLTATSCRVYYKTLTNGGSITTPANVIRIPPPCAGDFTGDGVVNTFDLSAFLSKFGLLVPPGTPQDMNNDGIVNTFDLSLFLANFGKQC